MSRRHIVVSAGPTREPGDVTETLPRGFVDVLYRAMAVDPNERYQELASLLDAQGLRGRTLVVYLADHGEALGDHGEKTHSVFVYGSTLDVPLIVAPPLGAKLGAPGLELAGRRVRGLARLVDVTPTVLDLVGLGVDKPGKLDPERLVTAHPLLPRRQRRAPTVRIGLEPRLARVGQRALRAVIEVRLLFQNREMRSQLGDLIVGEHAQIWRRGSEGSSMNAWTASNSTLR